MATYSTLGKINHGDAAVTGTTAMHYETLGVVASAEARAGQYRGSHSGTCQASGAASGTVSLHQPCQATAVVTGTTAMHYETLGVVCQADAAASGETWHARPSLARYELYHAEDEATMDYSSPAETFTSLPHTTTLTLDAGKTHRLVTWPP